MERYIPVEVELRRVARHELVAVLQDLVDACRANQLTQPYRRHVTINSVTSITWSCFSGTL